MDPVTLALAKKLAGEGSSSGGGVTSFNGRSGAVTPGNGDYSVEQVTGAAPLNSPNFINSISLLRKSGTTVGQFSCAVGQDVAATASWAHAEGHNSNANGNASHAEGDNTTAGGNYSHAEGGNTTANGGYSHAEGERTLANSSYAHAEGQLTKAKGACSHAEGYDTTASGSHAHAEGSNTIASGMDSHAEGSDTKADGAYSHASGYDTYATSIAQCSYVSGQGTIANASHQYVIGKYNISNSTNTVRFIIGKGSSNTSRANCFRITDTGVYASGNYNASGADYAELFEWLDGNPDNEDRTGLFATLDGEKIRLATPEDNFILGVVSGNPSIVGDVHDDQWQGMYLYDIFGRPLFEEVDVPDETTEYPDPEHPGETIAEVIAPAHTETRQKLNPKYDHTKLYLARTERPEWAAVGMLGKLVVCDDGSCEVNGWAKVGSDGRATDSVFQTKYRVMSRLDETHIRVLIV